MPLQRPRSNLGASNPPTPESVNTAGAEGLDLTRTRERTLDPDPGDGLRRRGLHDPRRNRFYPRRQVKPPQTANSTGSASSADPNPLQDWAAPPLGGNSDSHDLRLPPDESENAWPTEP